MIQNLRSSLRGKVLDFLGSFAKPAPGVHILNGHRLINTEDSVNLFKIVLEHLSKNALLICPDEAVILIKEKANVDKPMIAFSFDDGFSECYSHFAPALEDFGIRGLFFINPNYVEGDDQYIELFNKNCVHTQGKKPMRWYHVEELNKRGHIIGAHTLDHVMIKGNDEKALKHQIVDCKQIIEKHIGKECDYFAFPYGRLDNVDETAIFIACENFKFVFSQSNYKHYYSFNDRVINRRHFEPFWPLNHIDYFLSCKKTY